MTDYASFTNFRKAALLAVPITLLAAPRILLHGFPVVLVLEAYLALVLIGAMATAWSEYAGMSGLFPEFEITRRGFVVVSAVLAVVIPLQIFLFNPMLHREVLAAGDKTAIDILFPKTISQSLAFVFWAMSFETLFFRAAAMSFFAKLTKHFVPAVILTVLFRVFVGYLKFNQIEMVCSIWPILGMVGLMSAVSCYIFARYGLLPTMILAGGLVLTRLTP